MSSPAAHEPNEEFHTPTKAGIKALARYAHMNNCQISRATGVPRTTVRDIVRSSVVRHDGPKRRGRKSIINEEQIEELVAKATESWTGRTLSWVQLAGACGVEASQDTIRRTLNSVGFHKCKACRHPFISEASRQKRIDYAVKYKDYDSPEYGNWCWSDEAAFTTGVQATRYVTRQRSERQHRDCTQNRYRSGRSTFTVWGAIGWNWKSHLIILEGSGPRGGFTQDDYIHQVLEPEVARFFEEKNKEGYELTMYEDGNRAHGCHREDSPASQAKRRLGIRSIASPPSSPDFNIIENVWRIIKSRLKRRVFTRKEDLKRAVLEEWDRLQPHEWMQYVYELRKRLKECRERRGLATSY